MLLVFDAGNTTIGMALVDNNDKIIDTFKLNTNLKKTDDEYFIDIKHLVDCKSVSKIIISSVVPIITKVLIAISEKNFKVTPVLIQPKTKTGINILTDNPKEVGADIIATAAAVASNTESTLIIDLGTATKYTYVRKNQITGVIITPGIKISFKALAGNTALLPEIDIEVPKKVLGTNTAESMQSGATYGIAAQVDGLIEFIKKEVKEDFKIVVTGGLSNIIIPLVNHETILRPNLIYEGLVKIFYKNN